MSSTVSSSSQPTDMQADIDMDDAMTTTTNVDPSEVDKFNKLDSEWWDKTRALATLHEINPLRLYWIEEYVIRGYSSNDVDKTAEQGLSGKKILDVGCGGGRKKISRKLCPPEVIFKNWRVANCANHHVVGFLAGEESDPEKHNSRPQQKR
jgi:hypothetical protein